jgi:hypothetical protein
VHQAFDFEVSDHSSTITRLNLIHIELFVSRDGFSRSRSKVDDVSQCQSTGKMEM